MSFATLVDAIKYRTEHLGHKPAFIFRDKHGGRKVLSWQQCFDLGGRFAAVLRSGSIGRGRLVVNTLPNSQERVISELGIVMSGAASVNAHCQLADGSDLLHTLKKSKAHAIVLDPDIPNGPWSVLKKLIREENDACQGTHRSLFVSVKSDELPSLRDVYKARRVEDGGQEDFLSHLETLTEHYTADDVRPDDTLSIFTTSGSTGFSKLVPHTHKNVNFGMNDGNELYGKFAEDRIHFCLAPLGWGGGYVGYSFFKGNVRVLCDDRIGPPGDPVEFVKMCFEEEGCTDAFLLPAVTLQLAEKYGQSVEETGACNAGEASPVNGRQNGATDSNITRGVADSETMNGEADSNTASGAADCKTVNREADSKTTSGAVDTKTTTADRAADRKTFKNGALQCIVLAGLPVSRTMVQAARRVAHSVCVCYGSTEFMAASTYIVTDADSFVDFDSGLVTMGTEVKVVDPENEEKVLPNREVGHILIKRILMMKEYLNDPEASAAAFTHDGYFRTGDIGCIDDRGHLIVQGRGSDAIMRGPYIFYPGWLEARIRACPGVSDVVVVGVPDPLVTEELCACLVLTSDDVTVEEVRQFVEKDILASEDDPLSPRPRHYLKFESFPLTTTDKPNRKTIKKIAAKRLGRV